MGPRPYDRRDWLASWVRGAGCGMMGSVASRVLGAAAAVGVAMLIYWLATRG